MSEVEHRFTQLVAGLDYPMHIVTAADEGERAGCLVGFATQCSVRPPRYWVCISKRNRTWPVASRAHLLVVHFPGPEDIELVRLFGEETGDEVDKFARCRWRPGPDGRTPVLTACPRWFAGRVLERVDTGDHVSVLVEPVDAEGGDGGPQLGFQAVRDLDPGHQA